MAFKSSFTSQQIEDRIKQGYYDDILQAGLDGNVFTDETKPSKQEMDLQLAKLGNGQQVQITKEAIESVLTGSITTHRHDTTYQEKTFETDVWDGSSISSSLQGSGTKDDPYLIQSCADWLHVYLKADQYAIYNDDNYTAATEFKPVFKLMKNLDFGSKDIDVSSLEGIGSTIAPMCEFDGNHAKISNFKTSIIEDTQFGVFSPFLVFTFCHDFILDNIEIEINEKNATGITLWGTPGQDLTYSAALNNIIDLKVAFRGNVPTETGRISIPIITESGYLYAYNINPAINKVIDNYIQENGRFCGCSAVGVDGVDSGWELKADLIFLSPYDTYKQAPVIYCSNSLSEIELPTQYPPTFVGNRNVNVTYLIMGQEPAKFYSNSDGSDKIAIQNLEGETTTFTTTPKSLTEMQSESFVEELNSLLPKPAFKKDPEGGTPILAQYGEIDYDGYVKQSQFEKFKTEVSQNKEVIYTDINFFQNKHTGVSNQRFITEENFIEDLGGVEAVKEMIRMIANDSMTANSYVVIYTVPLLVSISNKMYINLTNNNQAEPEDGDSFVFGLQCSAINGNEPLFLEMNCSVADFNQSGMIVKVNQKQYKLVNSDNIMKIKKLTQSEYDGLSTKDGYTLYVIVG